MKLNIIVFYWSLLSIFFLSKDYYFSIQRLSDYQSQNKHEQNADKLMNEPLLKDISDLISYITRAAMQEKYDVTTDLNNSEKCIKKKNSFSDNAKSGIPMDDWTQSPIDILVIRKKAIEFLLNKDELFIDDFWQKQDRSQNLEGLEKEFIDQLNLSEEDNKILKDEKIPTTEIIDTQLSEKEDKILNFAHKIAECNIEMRKTKQIFLRSISEQINRMINKKIDLDLLRLKINSYILLLCEKDIEQQEFLSDLETRAKENLYDEEMYEENSRKIVKICKEILNSEKAIVIFPIIKKQHERQLKQENEQFLAMIKKLKKRLQHPLLQQKYIEGKILTKIRDQDTILLRNEYNSITYQLSINKDLVLNNNSELEKTYTELTSIVNRVEKNLIRNKNFLFLRNLQREEQTEDLQQLLYEKEQLQNFLKNPDLVSREDIIKQQQLNKDLKKLKKKRCLLSLEVKMRKKRAKIMITMLKKTNDKEINDKITELNEYKKRGLEKEIEDVRDFLQKKFNERASQETFKKNILENENYLDNLLQELDEKKEEQKRRRLETKEKVNLLIAQIKQEKNLQQEAPEELSDSEIELYEIEKFQIKYQILYLRRDAKQIKAMKYSRIRIAQEIADKYFEEIETKIEKMQGSSAQKTLCTRRLSDQKNKCRKRIEKAEEELEYEIELEKKSEEQLKEAINENMKNIQKIKEEKKAMDENLFPKLPVLTQLQDKQQLLTVSNNVSNAIEKFAVEMLQLINPQLQELELFKYIDIINQTELISTRIKRTQEQIETQRQLIAISIYKGKKKDNVQTINPFSLFSGPQNKDLKNFIIQAIRKNNKIYLEIFTEMNAYMHFYRYQKDIMFQSISETEAQLEQFQLELNKLKKELFPYITKKELQDTLKQLNEQIKKLNNLNEKKSQLLEEKLKEISPSNNVKVFEETEQSIYNQLLTNEKLPVSPMQRKQTEKISTRVQSIPNQSNQKFNVATGEELTSKQQELEATLRTPERKSSTYTNKRKLWCLGGSLFVVFSSIGTIIYWIIMRFIKKNDSKEDEEINLS